MLACVCVLLYWPVCVCVCVVACVVVCVVVCVLCVCVVLCVCAYLEHGIPTSLSQQVPTSHRLALHNERQGEKE